MTNGAPTRESTNSGSGRRLMGLPAVILIAVGAAVAQSFGRFTYGVLLPAVRDDFGISNTTAGSLGTMNVAAYLVGTMGVAWAAGRYRLLDIMRVGFVLSAAGLFLAAYSPNVPTLGIALFLAGLGGACIWIPSPVIAADAIAAERRSLAIGLLGSGIGLGVVVTGQLSAFVRSSMGDAHWRRVYVIESGIAFVVLVGVFLLIGHSQTQPSSKGGFGGVTALKRMRGWVPLTLAYTAFGLMYLLVIAFLTTRLEDDSGWTGSQAAFAFTLVGIAMIFGGPALVALAQRIGARLTMSFAFALWACLALLVLPGWLAPTMAASVGIGMLFSGLPSMMTTYVVENTTTDDYGPSFAAATLAFGVAQMISPQLGGLVADLTGSFTLVFVLSAIMAVVGLACSLRLPRPG